MEILHYILQQEGQNRYSKVINETWLEFKKANMNNETPIETAEITTKTELQIGSAVINVALDWHGLSSKSRSHYDFR